MRKAPHLAVLLGLTLCLPLSDKTAAEPLDPSGVVYVAARNKIGLMRYCRYSSALDAALAEKAAEAIQASLRALRIEDRAVLTEGDRAEKAGEDGFLEAGRRRDITSFAALFHTTRAGLCNQWAEETVRLPEAAPRSQPISIAAIQPIRAIPPIAPPALIMPRAVVLPPLPAKAPFRRGVPGLALTSRTVTTAAHLGNHPSAAPQIIPMVAPLANKAAEPEPRQAVAPAVAPLPAPAPTRRRGIRPTSFLDNWPFNRFQKPYNLRERPWRQ